MPRKFCRIAAEKRCKKSGIALVKKSVDNLLLLAHEFLALLQTIGFALNIDDRTVMQDTVEDSGGDGDIGKDLVPLGESFVGGEDGRGLFIASGNELEEKVGSLDIHRKVADLVNDEHPVLGQDFELVGQTILKVSFFELLNELVAVDVVGGEPVLSSHQTKGGSQVGLSNGPRKTTFSPFSRKRMVASSSIWRLSMEGWKEKSKSSRVFLMGKPDICTCFS